MKTPLMMKTVFSVAAIFLMSACASDSGSSGGTANQQAPVSNKLALKNTGSKQVLVGSSRDLRDYLVHADDAEFKVIQGQALVKWTDAELPKIMFKQAGSVLIRVTDTVDQTRVDLRFKVVFDTTGLGHDVDLGHPGDDIPVIIPRPPHH